MYSQLKEEMDKLSADRASIDLRRKEAEGQLQSREVKIRSLDNENNALRKRIEEMEKN
jgi:chromosome segregation ATPase